jgi:micrococcal nuclease
MPRRRSRKRTPQWIVAACAVLALATALWRQSQEGHQPPETEGRPAAAQAAPKSPKSRLAPRSGERIECSLVRVVDGDTLAIRAPDGKGGEAEEKVRLQCVDTEEAHGGKTVSKSKPLTEFGLFTSEWAAKWFAPTAESGGPARMALVFEPGLATRDAFGRLLAEVEYRGEVYNLHLVREGYSPYFNKYGHSVLYHEQFVAAQAEARSAKRGIWDPKTNRGGVTRPYDTLLPWWQARAEAVDRFRAYEREHPGKVLSLERDLEAVRAKCGKGEQITVFAPISGIRSVSKGNLWVELGAPEDQPFILFVPASARKELDAIPISRFKGEGKQNYVYLSGTGSMYRDMAEITLSSRSQVSEDPPEG